MVVGMVEWFFRLVENVLYMGLYRTFLKTFLSSTTKGSPVSMMSSLLQQKNPWFYIEYGSV